MLIHTQVKTYGEALNDLWSTLSLLHSVLQTPATFPSSQLCSFISQRSLGSVGIPPAYTAPWKLLKEESAQLISLPFLRPSLFCDVCFPRLEHHCLIFVFSRWGGKSSLVYSTLTGSINWEYESFSIHDKMRDANKVLLLHTEGQFCLKEKHLCNYLRCIVNYLLFQKILLSLVEW